MKSLIAAAGVAAAAELLERKRSADGLQAERQIQPTVAGGFDAGRAAASRSMPCGVPRLTTGSYGIPIRTDSKGGTDFLREATIQRNSLLVEFGPIGWSLFNRPRISAACAKVWIEQWMAAWSAARRANPGAFAVTTMGRLIGQPLASSWVEAERRWADWRDPMPQGKRTDLGQAVERLKTLHAQASATSSIPLLGDFRPWIGARTTTEAVYGLARELDTVGFEHGDAEREGLAELARDLAPGKFLAKATEAALVPVEIVAANVAGPLAGAVLGVTLPYLVIGGALYLVTR